jgi:predicted DNA-binding antitoxin AbrB/MazE fold protein
MTITVDATFVSGVLRPDQPLPLAENSRVRIVVESAESAVDRTAGILPWKGDPALLERIAMDPEFGISEAP